MSLTWPLHFTSKLYIHTIQLPSIYYAGYRAQVNGKRIHVVRTTFSDFHLILMGLWAKKCVCVNLKEDFYGSARARLKITLVKFKLLLYDKNIEEVEIGSELESSQDAE